MQHNIRKKSAFTLVELVAITVILGIVPAIAFPTYINLRERSLARQAIINVLLLKAAEQAYYQRNEHFVFCQCYGNDPAVANSCDYPGAAGNPAGCNVALGLHINSTHWGYWVQLYSPSRFGAAAVRLGRNCWYELNYTIGDPPGVPAPPAGHSDCSV